jgi:putative ATP-binding cassette transporter
MVKGKLDKRIIDRFILIAKPFFTSELRSKAIGLLILLICFAITLQGVNVLLSYVGRDFMTALSLRQKDEFIHNLLLYLLAFALATPMVVFYRYTEERLTLLWRRWLSLHVVGKYLGRRAYYQLTWDDSIDNPDQRIEEDVRTFCSQTLSFFLIILNSCIAVVAFMKILFQISEWLSLAVIAYAFVGSVTTYFLGKPLISLNFAQLKKDADYRYKLINIRDNAEAVAFYGVESREITRIRQKLVEALDNLLSIINWNRNLNFFTTGYNYIVSILPTIIVAPLYLDGKIEFGVVTQAAFAFAQVLGALSIIVLNFQSISTYLAVIKRLGSFIERVHEFELLPVPSSTIQIIETKEKGLQIKNLNIYAPRTDAALIKDLNLNIASGSLLITGPSGSGKSSIIRAVSGLWERGEGEIFRPQRSECFFIPQRPYTGLGTFRSLLLYGLHRRGFLDHELMSVVNELELGDLVRRIGGLNTTLDWPSVLAAGEQQRIAFARLFLARPSCVFLDEATTALEPENEQEIYIKLKKVANIIISVGHRAMLSKYHDTILELKGDGSWSVQKGQK